MVDTKGDLSFTRLERHNFKLLARWLAEPHVARWWNHDFSPDAVEADFGPTADGREPAEDWLVLLDGEPVGLIQFYFFHDYPEYVEEMAPIMDVSTTAGSIDYLIGLPDMTGRGLGPAMINAFVDRLVDAEPRLGSLVVPVAAGNPASWKALQRAGFTKIAEGDLEPDNPIDPPLHFILERILERKTPPTTQTRT